MITIRLVTIYNNKVVALYKKVEQLPRIRFDPRYGLYICIDEPIMNYEQAIRRGYTPK